MIGQAAAASLARCRGDSRCRRCCCCCPCVPQVTGTLLSLELETPGLNPPTRRILYNGATLEGLERSLRQALGGTALPLAVLLRDPLLPDKLVPLRSHVQLFNGAHLVVLPATGGV